MYNIFKNYSAPDNKGGTLAVSMLNDTWRVGDRGIVSLIGVLEHNTTLRTLGLERCGINEGGSGELEPSGSCEAVNRLE